MFRKDIDRLPPLGEWPVGAVLSIVLTGQLLGESTDPLKAAGIPHASAIGPSLPSGWSASCMPKEAL